MNAADDVTIYCWWRHNCITWPGSCDAGMRKALFTARRDSVITHTHMYINIYRHIYIARAFSMNPKVGVWVPLRSRHFLSRKFWHFHKNTRSCVENECGCPCTANISNLTLLQISIPPEPVLKIMVQQTSGPDSSNGKNIWHESECWGFEFSSGRDFSVLKTLTLSQEHPFICRKWMLLPPHRLHFKC